MRLIVTAVLVAAVLAPNVWAQDEPDPDPSYWMSAEASFALRDSDWAADRKVVSVSCAGRGAYVTRYGYPHFKTFRCALRNSQGRLVAHVTLTTAAPEQFQLTNLTNRLKVCR